MFPSGPGSNPGRPPPPTPPMGVCGGGRGASAMVEEHCSCSGARVDEGLCESGVLKHNHMYRTAWSRLEEEQKLKILFYLCF